MQKAQEAAAQARAQRRVGALPLHIVEGLASQHVLMMISQSCAHMLKGRQAPVGGACFFFFFQSHHTHADLHADGGVVERELVDGQLQGVEVLRVQGIDAAKKQESCIDRIN